MIQINTDDRGRREVTGPMTTCNNCHKIIILKNGSCPECGTIMVSSAPRIIPDPSLSTLLNGDKACTSCGKGNAPNANFCNECGLPFSVSKPTRQTVPL